MCLEMAWQLVMSLLLLGAASSAGVVPSTNSGPRARACGTVPLSCAPACGKAIEQAMIDCSGAGGGTVALVAGTYHVNDSNWVAERQPTIILKNLHNVALVGQVGSGDYYTNGPDPAATTLLIYGLKGALSLENCSNIKVQGVHVDMQRQPYTYGQCTAATATSFTVQFDAQRYPFPNPLPDYLLQVQSVMGFDPVNWRMAYAPTDIYTTSVPYKCSVTDDKITCSTPPRPGTPIAPGRWYVLRHEVYGPGGFAVQHSTNIEAQDVQLYSAPGMGFVHGQTKNVHLKNCGVRWRPGRPMSITADASHFNECSGLIHLEGVHFEGQGDDCTNVHGMFHDVRMLSPSQFELGSRPAGGISAMNIGGRYEFRNRNNWTIEGVGICTATSITGGKQYASFDWEEGSSAAKISEFALLTDLSLQPSVLIEDSYFGNNRARGTLIKTSNVLVRNNFYNYSSAHCLLAFPDGCYWFESGGFRNWSIINNTFHGCGAGGGGDSDIFVAACAPIYNAQGLPTKNGNPITRGQPFAQGTIFNNTFIQAYAPHRAVELYGFNGLSVQSNTIELIPNALEALRNFSSIARPEAELCPDLCGSFDGFSVSKQQGARVWGWAVDTKLAKPNISSHISVEVDGAEVWSALANGLRPDLVGKVSNEPQHGFDTHLPSPVVTKLLDGNHTVAVFAWRQDGTKAQLNKNLYCINPYRLECQFPADCDCGAPKPSRLLISNSIQCVEGSNTCDGKPCIASTPVNGCVER